MTSTPSQRAAFVIPLLKACCVENGWKHCTSHTRKQLFFQSYWFSAIWRSPMTNVVLNRKCITSRETSFSRRVKERRYKETEEMRWGAQMEGERMRWGVEKGSDGRNDGTVRQRHMSHPIRRQDEWKIQYCLCRVRNRRTRSHSHTHTQDSRPSQAYLALHGCAASMQSSRSCRRRPGSFWTVSLNAMSLPVME